MDQLFRSGGVVQMLRQIGCSDVEVRISYSDVEVWTVVQMLRCGLLFRC